MLIHVDDLVPNMRLEHDIELSAGSFLITLKELPEGKLTEEVIGSIRRFASQLTPEQYKVKVVGDELVLEHLKEVLENDVKAIIKMIESGTDYPNFLSDNVLREKVERVMEKLVSNPDIIGNMYQFKLNTKSGVHQGNYLPDHCIRVTLLAIAVGLKLRWSIISLVNVGMAAILHDLGILETEVYPNFRKLDDFSPGELEAFIEEHQECSEKIFSAQKLTILPHTRNEIKHMLANHHRPDLGTSVQKTTLLLYLAELVDEMLAPMPHKIRYNFTQVQRQKLGKRFENRVGLMSLLLGLVKLFRGEGILWEMVQAIAQTFSMQELLVENYEEKLKKSSISALSNVPCPTRRPAGAPFPARFTVRTAARKNSPASMSARPG
ncbi:MAG: HD domain-containing protein [Candidatus Glassbacteria bacterium]|nr:HD domain-containing protein [Candidatus Glassbacteria bacterium]